MRASVRRSLVEGLVAGLVAYASVVLLFVLVNAALGRALFDTPARLGTALLGGAASGAAPVLAYNGAHLLASLGVGFLAAWLLREAEDHHDLWYPVFFVFLMGFIWIVVALGVVAAEVAGVMSWSAVLSGTTVAALAMGIYLWASHRSLGRQLGAEIEL